MSHRRSYPCLRSAALAALISAAVVLFGSGYRPEWLFVDWTSTKAVPFPIKDKLEIASQWYPLKRSSVSLLCGSDGAHLMLKSRLGMPSWIRAGVRPSKEFSARTEVILDWTPVPGGVTGHSLQTRSARVKLGAVDTVVTAPLTRQDESTLVDWFRRGAPQGLYFAVSEEGAGKLTGTTTAPDVIAFLQDCSAPI